MPDDIVKEAMDAFQEASEAENDNRKAYREDIEFALLDKQWPKDIEAQRMQERRPCLTLNKLGPVVRQVVNDARQNRPSTSVRPIDSKSDPETAEVLTGLVRSIESYSNADVAYDTAVLYAVAGGFGYWKINLDYAMNAVSEEDLKAAGPGAFEQDICIKSVPNPLNIYGDPYAIDGDTANWNRAHEVEVLSGEQFKKKYPGAQKTDFGGVEWQSVMEPWRDGDDVQVAAYWKREEAIKRAFLVQMPDEEPIIAFEEDIPALQAQGAQVAEMQPREVKTYKVRQHMVSGVEELSSIVWPGAYIPIVSVMGDEVNLEGKRYLRSLIRPARDAQKNFNYWRTTVTEAVALAPRVPYIGPKGAFETDAAKWQTANSQSHSFIEYDGPQKPERQANMSLPTGMMQEALSAADDIKAITGIYDASLGARSNETSGKAIMARQREGDVSTFHFIDNLTRGIRHSGRIIVDLIPKVYSTERIIRILGEDGSSKDVPLNQPFEDQSGVMRLHDVRTGRYDVSVKAGPSFTSRREEAATQMIELLRAYPDAAPIIGDLLAKNLDWPGADEIAKRLEAMLPPEARGEQQQGIDPAMQQQMQQMGEALQQMQQELAAAKNDTALKAKELDIKAFEAETDRMEAVHKMTQPTELPQEAPPSQRQAA